MNATAPQLLEGANPRAADISSSSAWSLHLTFLIMALAVMGASLALGVNPMEKVTLPFASLALPSVCHFRNITGLDCPGCGLSRSFIHLARGDVLTALKYNPASLLVFAFVLAQIPYRSAQLWRIRQGRAELRWQRLGNWALAIVTLALVAQWLVRMFLAVLS